MLKWKKKLYWRDEEDDKLYIHPIAAFAGIAAVMFVLWKVILPAIS